MRRRASLGAADAPAAAQHPAYKHDSIVTQQIAYDLCVAARDIGDGKRVERDLVADLQQPPPCHPRLRTSFASSLDDI